MIRSASANSTVACPRSSRRGSVHDREVARIASQNGEHLLLRAMYGDELCFVGRTDLLLKLLLQLADVERRGPMAEFRSKVPGVRLGRGDDFYGGKILEEPFRHDGRDGRESQEIRKVYVVGGVIRVELTKPIDWMTASQSPRQHYAIRRHVVLAQRTLDQVAVDVQSVVWIAGHRIVVKVWGIHAHAAVGVFLRFR